MTAPQTLEGAAVLGAGRFGHWASRVLAKAGIHVRVWDRDSDAANRVAADQERIEAASSVADAAHGAGLVFFAVPSGAIREVARLYGEVATGDQLVVHACRGVGEDFELPHQAIRGETCVRKVGVLGGPLHSLEKAGGRPLAAVLASRYDELTKTIARLCDGGPVRIHPSRDVIGVEVAGVISNVSAIAVGVSDALGHGDTSRGVLLTHGLTEATALGTALGADPQTYAGLAGVGDLIPRRVTSTERHHGFGQALASGKSAEEALAEASGEVEGARTAAEATKLADRLELDLALVRTVSQLVAGEIEPGPAIEALLQRDLAL